MDHSGPTTMLLGTATVGSTCPYDMMISSCRYLRANAPFMK